MSKTAGRNRFDNAALLAALALVALVIWVVLTLVLGVRSGWAHLPLVIGVLILAKAIVESGTREPGDDSSSD